MTYGFDWPMRACTHDPETSNQVLRQLHLSGCQLQVLGVSEIDLAMNAFLRAHSQKFAAAAFAGAALLSYTAQPHVEVFTRWQHMKTLAGGQEMRPSPRILEIANRAFEMIGMPKSSRERVEIFLIDGGDAIALGGISESESRESYAFIGIPYFCIYVDVDDIPLGDLHFASPVFPFTAQSRIGQERLQLMRLSDAALEFLIAREAARLMGAVTPRNAARITSLSTLATLYLSYQVCYFLNRLLGLPTHLRALSYFTIGGVLVLCQRQLLSAWRDRACFAVDRRVVSSDSHLLSGGIDYYTWKQTWNRFWAAEALPAGLKAMDLLRKVSRGVIQQKDGLPPLSRYQLRMALHDLTYLYRDPADYYFIPPSIEYPCTATTQQRLDNCDPTYLTRTRIPPYTAATARRGDEKFAADGEVLRPGLAGLFALGAMPTSALATFYQLVSAAPTATSARRRDRLIAAATHDQQQQQQQQPPSPSHPQD